METQLKNPWLLNSPGYPNCQYVSSADRMDIVRHCADPDLLRAIVAWPETQSTVKSAAERRLRVLAIEQKGNPS